MGEFGQGPVGSAKEKPTDNLLNMLPIEWKEPTYNLL